MATRRQRLPVRGDVQVSPPPAGPPDTLSLVSYSTAAASPPLTCTRSGRAWTSRYCTNPTFPGMALPATSHFTAFGDVGLGTSQLFSLFLWAHLPQATLSHLQRPWLRTASLSFLLLLVLPSMSSAHTACGPEAPQ